MKKDSDDVIGSQIKNFISGGLAGAISKTVVAPMERVKLIMQTEAENSKVKKEYAGSFDCFKRCIEEEGFLSLWRGNGVNVIRYFPTQALNFTFKDYFNSLSTISLTSTKTDILLTRIINGGLAGAATTMFVHPLDFVRTRIAVDLGKSLGQRQFTGMFDCYAKIYRAEGIRGWYRGLAISIPSIFIYRGLYFGIYDAGKQTILTQNSSVVVRFFWAQWAVIFSQLLAYPGDTVKRKMMMQSITSKIEYKGIIDCFVQTYKRDGLKGLWRGAYSNMLRSIGSSLCLVLYDEFQKKFQSL